MEIIEHLDRWNEKYASWKQKQTDIDKLAQYPFVENTLAPFTPARRALTMMQVGVISSAGAYIDGTEPFDTQAAAGDLNFREIPSQIDLHDLRFAARGYDPRFVQQDANVQVPLRRLFEFEINRIIGQLNSVFWSFSGFLPDAGRFVNELIPKLVERIHRYEVHSVLLIPASRLCHQSCGLAARAIELTGIPTITLAVEQQVAESVRPSRVAFYNGQFGSVAGQPNWPEHQRRVLDEALRWLEPMGEPGLRKLAVELESKVEAARGER
jgi:hypothetical protein